MLNLMAAKLLSSKHMTPNILVAKISGFIVNHGTSLCSLTVKVSERVICGDYLNVTFINGYSY